MLKDKLQADQLSALKTGQPKLLMTLRYILSQIKNQEIEKKSDLEDDEILKVLRKIAKELKESIDAFEKGGRADLADDSKAELAIISSYLPAQMSDVDLKKEVENIVKSNQDLYNQNPKAVIGLCMKELRDKADSSRIMAQINSLK